MDTKTPSIEIRDWGVDLEERLNATKHVLLNVRSFRSTGNRKLSFAFAEIEEELVERQKHLELLIAEREVPV